MMVRPREFVLVAAFVLLGGGLRFARIESIPPGLWYDEARNSLELARWVEDLHPTLRSFCGEPLYGVPGTVVGLLRGVDERTLRITSALIGTVSILVFWWALGRTWGSSVGLLGAFFLAVSQWHLIFSRIGFRGILLPPMVCLSVWAFEKAWRRSRVRDWTVLGIILGLGWYSYIPFKIMPFLFIGQGVLRSRRGDPAGLRRSRVHGAVRAAFLIFLFILPWFFTVTKAGKLLDPRIGDEQVVKGGASGLLENAGRVLGMFVWVGDTNPRHNLAGAPCLPWFLLPFLALGMVWSLRNIRHSPKSQMLWFLWLGLLLPSVLSRDAPHALRTIGAVVPTAVFWADGVRITRVWMFRLGPRWLRSATSRYLLTAVGAVVMVAWTTNFYFYRYATQPGIEHAFQSRHYRVAERARSLPEDHLVLFSPIVYGRATVVFMMRNRPGPIFLDRIADFPGLEVPSGGVDVFLFDRTTVERHFAANVVETYVFGDDEYFCTRVHLSPADGEQLVDLAYQYY